MRCGKRLKFATKPIWHYPPHLRHVATLPWKVKDSNFYRYSADMEENANKLHLCIDYNASTRVTVYAGSFLKHSVETVRNAAFALQNRQDSYTYKIMDFWSFHIHTPLPIRRNLARTIHRTIQVWTATSVQIWQERKQLLKVIWQKGRIVAAHGRFNGISQVAPVCTGPNTCFLGSIRVHTPNGISIGWAVLAGLSTVTHQQSDRPTDRPRYLDDNNRLHLRTYNSTAVRPKTETGVKSK